MTLESLQKHKAALKKSRPKFSQQGAKNIKRLSDKWRKPRGFHSKMRKYKKGKPRMVAVGFKGPRELQDVLNSGFKEKLVHNVKELNAVNPKIELAVVGSSVGKRKTLAIIAEAKKLGIKFSNINPEKKVKDIEAFLTKRKAVKLAKTKKAEEKKKRAEKEKKGRESKKDKKSESKDKNQTKPVEKTSEQSSTGAKEKSPSKEEKKDDKKSESKDKKKEEKETKK